MAYSIQNRVNGIVTAGCSFEQFSRREREAWEIARGNCFCFSSIGEQTAYLCANRKEPTERGKNDDTGERGQLLEQGLVVCEREWGQL